MKLTLTRLLDTGRILATEPGQQLAFFFSYLAEFVEQTIRALRNGLTFSDNFACEIKRVTLTSGEAQTITASRQVTGAVVMRVVSQTSYLTGFNYYYDTRGELTVIAEFSSGASTSHDVVILLLF